MRRAPICRSLFAWALVALTCATAAPLHNHVSLSELLGDEVGAHGGQRAITSHDPLSAATHWHRVVRYVDDNCPICHSQRAARPVAAVAASTESLPARLAAAPSADLTLVRPAITDGSRAPPSLL